MKASPFLMLILYLLTLPVASAETETLTHCDQQLLQASISCADSESLENCIVAAITDDECNIEISNKEDVDVDFCNEDCMLDLNLSL